MIQRLLNKVTTFRQPWRLAVVLAVLIPFVPEYIAPICAGCSLTAAYTDARSNHRRMQIGSMGKWLLLYTAYILIGLLYARNRMSTLATFGMWAVMMMGYLSVYTVIVNRRRLDTVLAGICLTMGVIGVIGVFQYVLRKAGLHVPLQFWSWADGVVYHWMPMPLLPGSDALRVSGTFNNPNILAEYLVMVLPFAIFYAFCGKRSKLRLICRGCVLAAVCAVLFTFSRGCYLVLLTIAFIFCVANRKKAAVMILSVTSLLLLVPDSVISRLGSLSSADNSVSERLSIWKYGIQTIGDHPVFGVGAGVYNTWELLLDGGINAPHMHNLILQLFAEGGGIAVAIMAVIVLKLLLSSLALLRVKETDTHQMGVILLAFAAVIVVNGMSDFPLLTPRLVGIFVMMFAIADSAVKLSRPLTKNESFLKPKRG